VLLVGLVVTGGSVGLRHLAEWLTPGGASRPALVVICYVVLLSLLNEVSSILLGFYSGFVIERRYGLSNQTFGGWLLDQLKGLALGMILGGVAASVLYFFIRRSPDSWWLPASRRRTGRGGS